MAAGDTIYGGSGTLGTVLSIGTAYQAKQVNAGATGTQWGGYPVPATGLASTTGGTKNYGVPGVAFSAVNTLALSANADWIEPFYTNQPITIDSFLAEVTTGPSGAGNFEVGIYAAAATGQPSGAPLYDSGNIAVGNAATGVFTTAVSSVPLTPGQYVVVINMDKAMTFRRFVGSSTIGSIIPTAGTSPFAIGGSISRTYAAYPNPLTGFAAFNVSGIGSHHVVALRWT